MGSIPGSMFNKHHPKLYQEKHPQIAVLEIIPISNDVILSDGCEDE